jgi:hypothetical protein
LRPVSENHSENYYFTNLREEYSAAILRAPHGPLPILLVPMRRAARPDRRPSAAHDTVPRATARSATPATRATVIDRNSSRGVAPHATTPKKCACGIAVATPWLLWSVCASCGRVRPPTPREEFARLQLRLQLANAK